MCNRIEELLGFAHIRLREVKQTLKAIAATDREIQQATTVSKGIQQQELMSRYQREINRDLYEALDRLTEVQKQRKHEGSMGSFRHTPDLGMPTEADSFPSP